MNPLTMHQDLWPTSTIDNIANPTGSEQDDFDWVAVMEPPC